MQLPENNGSNSSVNLKHKTIKIAVASGKGGTGKTTVSVNLFHFINKYWNKSAVLVDCDVEEPNDLIFFPNLNVAHKKQLYHLIPVIDKDKCTFCKKCSDWCEFNAITIVKNLKFAEINNDFCHSCGACVYACKTEAINEIKHPLGTITHFSAGNNNKIIEGRLKIGSALQTMMIQKLKNEVPKNGSVIIYDAPPGTSCPVVQTVAGADYVILVTEPTPFGFHDLKITVTLLDKLHLKYGVVVNKAGIGNSDVYEYLTERKIELLGNIPFDRNYSASYSSGNIFREIPKEMREFYRSLAKKLKSKLES